MNEMNVQTVELSVVTKKFEKEGLEVPERAQHYINVVNRAISLQTELLNSSRNYKRLALASLTILTGLAFIPVGLPVMVGGAVLTCLIAFGCFCKMKYNSSLIAKEKTSFCAEISELQKEIIQKFRRDLPIIFNEMYDPSEISYTPTPDEYNPFPKTTTYTAMTLKDDVDLEQLQNQLRTWKEASRVIHSYNHVYSHIGTILNHPQISYPEQDEYNNRFWLFLKHQLEQHIMNISRVVENILDGANNRDITSLIRSIERI